MFSAPHTTIFLASKATTVTESRRDASAPHMVSALGAVVLLAAEATTITYVGREKCHFLRYYLFSSGNWKALIEGREVR